MTDGVCAGSVKVCDGSNGWTEPDYTQITNYEATEASCDGLDNDCDTQTDEGVKNTYYHDNDSDGYGNANQSTQACSAPGGYVANSTDCDDNTDTTHP